MNGSVMATEWVDYANEHQLAHLERLKGKVAELTRGNNEAAIMRAVQVGIQIADLPHLVKIPRSTEGKRRKR